MKKITFIFFVLSFSAYAQNLGTYGPVFEIQERSLLEVIQGRLQRIRTAELIAWERGIKEKVKAKVMTPEAVKGLQTTNKLRVFYFDPTIIVTKDMKDHLGRVFSKKSQSFNPLTILSWREPMLLLNGDDPKHVEWAQKQGENAKWVLIKGSPLKLEKRFKRRIFFDQEGRICQKLGIKQVPAKITQEKLKLKIEEEER